MSAPHRVCLLGLIGSLALACPADPRGQQAPDVVAEVGEWRLSRAELAAELSRSGVARIEGDEARTGVAINMAQRLVDERLLLQAAAKAQVTVEEVDVMREAQSASEGYPPGVFQRTLHAEKLTFADYRAIVKQRLIIEQFTRRELGKLPKITAEQVKSRYDKSVAGRTRAPEVRVRQVLVATREEATHLRAEVIAGRTTMEAAARRYSLAPDGQQGGDLGWFRKGDMPPVFNVCFSMKQGEISPVAESAWGAHLFEVIGVREEREESLVEAEERLYDELKREQQTQATEALVQRLREEAKAVLHQDAIKSAVQALGPVPEEELTGTGEGPPPSAPGVIPPAPKPAAPAVPQPEGATP